MTLWLGLFLWTLVLELPVYELGAGPRTKRWWHTSVLALAMNLLTHPLFTWWQYETEPSRLAVLGAELCIAAAEGLALYCLRRELGLGRALLVGAAANGTSYGLGLLAWHLLG